jgi:glucose-6-phosphate 1-dehydrogenase
MLKVSASARLNRETPQADPCVIVIFGAAGDLTRRLLVPALFNLRRERLLPEEFAIVGISRESLNQNTFRRNLERSLCDFGMCNAEDDDWKWLLSRLCYIQGEFNDSRAYQKLAKLLADTAKVQNTGQNYLFYLATPPRVFATVIRHLGVAGLTREEDGCWRRVIIEKPFGVDLHSAQALNSRVLKVLDEHQVYRIDHYLGKETVQNIMMLRFGNGIFEPLWNRNYIDHVQITVAETVGVEHRGSFYETTGALRDMVQNHLFQLLTLVAMEPPTCFAADAVRGEKLKVLAAVHPFNAQDARSNVARGQYGAGKVDGQDLVAYRLAPDVARDSVTETYIALKVMIDNWRWAGVPFYIRTGKALATRSTGVVIQFKQAPFAMFRDTPVECLTPNDLTLHIQPFEGVTLRFGAKIPGPSVRVGSVAMKFDYQDYFRIAPRTGYETLIYDCMVGDATLFKRADEVEAGWRIVQPIVEALAADHATTISFYPAGSSGPKEADVLMVRDGRRWRSLEQFSGTVS